ncbi:MAG: 2'-deoxycytidine 5'-triphosphate deaminase [Candidatus Parvarchaeota archaeon]|nr:2'-deoxycytidine 5'-triphosphate deaminase [Candidatus Jingweiarchaeum tengchongense]MCW1298214.1 2'-deoxycytidine 5'-triphosphate deaminase [Candidatus Jingweiarchaeum tengchongense]MCW1300012.1 2'-deoxycytidine 5'-triphosphate deaminase [Candidatus Jingweiarchaeum tengchongense]MCW1304849.1 2'-deoxycytidine 5'-triphosphate deaminase [Candidatus Jingweiarchaeum tengchongense]MCW1305439.1 2'-deoxycytidine 5'-triphosphate deaminase [Candidatus Jingweiarchaeum tengchongense]
MILADSMIRAYMESGLIKIEPRPNELQPASIDLRLGKIFELESVKYPNLENLVKNNDNGFSEYVKAIDKLEEKIEIKYRELPFESDDSILLRKGKLYFFETLERLCISDKVDEIFLASKSSLARLLVDLIPLGKEVMYKEKTPFSGKIFGNLISRVFDIKLYKNQKIMQCIFIEGSPTHISEIHVGDGFLKPVDGGTIDVRHLDNEIYEKLKDDHILLHHFTPGNEFFLAISNEDVDFSSAENAGIILPYHSMKRTCIAPFIDPGYKGKITLTLIGGAIPKIIKKGDGIADMLVHKMKGKVLRPYGHQELGSKYQGITEINGIRAKSMTGN